MTAPAQEWRTLPAGRELDAIVAERVMGLANVVRDWAAGMSPDGGGWDLADHADGTCDLLDGTTTYSWISERHPVHDVLRADGTRAYREIVPFYSTDIAAAWLVVEKLRVDGRWSFTLSLNGAALSQNGAKFWNAIQGLGRDIFAVDDYDGHSAVADTAPLAIVRAALQATEVPA